WVMENYQSLIHNVQSQVTDHGVESLLVAGRHQERSYSQQELATRQAELYELLAERASYEADVPLEISTRIQDLRRETNDLAEQLNQLDATPIHVSPGGTVAD